MFLKRIFQIVRSNWYILLATPLSLSSAHKGPLITSGLMVPLSYQCRKLMNPLEAENEADQILVPTY